MPLRKTQWDITLRRQFRFTERVSLQFGGDFFNSLNHPNFGSPINCLNSPQFGQAAQMLNNYLGSGGQSGGLNPLYQIGGTRSIQLALKLRSKTWQHSSMEADDVRELEQGHRSDPSRSEGPVSPHLAVLQRGSGLRSLCSVGFPVV
jgi:hypothetical protein